MIKDLEYTNRQILPRWVPFSQINVLNPIKNLVEENSLSEKNNYKKLENIWNTIKTVPLAVEIITTSHTLDIADTLIYKEAVDYLIENHCEVINENEYLCSLLGKSKNIQKTARENIHLLRNMSFINPSDDILWVDLAYFYAIQGQKKKAEKCIDTSLYLKPTNIFSIKSIIKYLLLTDNIEEALWLINSNDDLKNNPQLISTEISICESYGLKSKLLRKAYNITRDLQLRQSIENELFATIATMEFNSGNSKKGQKLFNQSLLYPNENIVAQSRYISMKFNKKIDNSSQIVPCSYERDSWVSYNDGDFEKAIDNSKNWFYFQPFSITPAMMNSYINSLIYNKEDEAIRIVNKALKISPKNFDLLNNKVVSLFRSNNLNEANRKLNELEKIDAISEDDATILLATQGLAAFRNNQLEEGINKYKQAIEVFKKKNSFEQYCRALYYFAYELKNANQASYLDIIMESKKLADKNSYKDIQQAIKNSFQI